MLRKTISIDEYLFSELEKEGILPYHQIWIVHT